LHPHGVDAGVDDLVLADGIRDATQSIDGTDADAHFTMLDYVDVDFATLCSPVSPIGATDAHGLENQYG
jgi:hypothetical protein